MQIFIHFSAQVESPNGHGLGGVSSNDYLCAFIEVFDLFSIFYNIQNESIQGSRVSRLGEFSPIT
jgi:hypothetical protein